MAKDKDAFKGRSGAASYSFRQATKAPTSRPTGPKPGDRAGGGGSSRPTEMFEVKQVTNEEGITNYVVVNKDTGEKVKGSPDFRFFDTAKAAILANEFPYVIREEEGSPAPDAEQSKEVRKEQPVRSDIETILSSFIEQGGASYDNVQSMVDAWEKWSKENEVEDSIKQKVFCL